MRQHGVVLRVGHSGSKQNSENADKKQGLLPWVVYKKKGRRVQNGGKCCTHRVGHYKCGRRPDSSPQSKTVEGPAPNTRDDDDHWCYKAGEARLRICCRVPYRWECVVRREPEAQGDGGRGGLESSCWGLLDTSSASFLPSCSSASPHRDALCMRLGDNVRSKDTRRCMTIIQVLLCLEKHCASLSLTCTTHTCGGSRKKARARRLGRPCP